MFVNLFKGILSTFPQVSQYNIESQEFMYVVNEI
jgi:hypothetical protein